MVWSLSGVYMKNTYRQNNIPRMQNPGDIVVLKRTTVNFTAARKCLDCANACGIPMVCS